MRLFNHLGSHHFSMHIDSYLADFYLYSAGVHRDMATARDKGKKSLLKECCIHLLVFVLCKIVLQVYFLNRINCTVFF